MNVSYVICAAGAGSRFQHISQKISKPFLKLNGKTLIERSFESLAIDDSDELIIIHRFSDEEVLFVQNKLSMLFRNKPIFIKLNQLTRGQAETALFAKAALSFKKVAIYNIDTFFRCKLLQYEIQKDEWDGIIPCFKALGDGWSFFKTQNQNDHYFATRAEEKVRISDWASVGFYYFKDSDLLFDIITESIQKQSFKSELYVAPFYNDLINRGKKCIVLDVEIFKPMGTVDQICRFWQTTEEDFVLENNY